MDVDDDFFSVDGLVVDDPDDAASMVCAAGIVFVALISIGFAAGIALGGRR